MTNHIIKEFAGYQIKQREDGYLNATEMCKVGGKKSNDYFRLDQTNEYLTTLSMSINIPIAQLIEKIMTGLNENRCTWVHPRVAIHLAQWISPQFAVKISEWIEEWYASAANHTRFLHEINNLKPSRSAQIEKEIQNKLAKEYDAKTEVVTEVGNIDLLTDTEIIEIKCASNWKSALGQVISYGEFYPNHSKKIILFGEVGTSMDTIKRICAKFGVEVKMHSPIKN
jgi:hypothetical protein